MTVSALTSTLLGTIREAEDNNSSTSSNASINTENFLNLLCVQLQYQDPLDPMDTNEMTSELCNLSQLEAAETTNDYLENLSLYNSSINNGLALECIGKTVSVSGDDVSITDGDAGDLSFELGDTASKVEITIHNEQGEEVRSISLGELEAGGNSMVWDGKDNIGNTLADGTYTFEIAAYDSNGGNIEVTTFVTSKVNGVVFRDGTAYLITSSGEIAYGDVTAVYQA